MLYSGPLGSTSGVLTNVNLRIIRDDAAQTTTYYLALPWSDVPLISTFQQNIGLSWLTNANLNDGKGRIGWFQWGSGIGNGRDASQFNFGPLMG